MRLYEHQASGNCLKCRVLLRQLGLAFETVSVDLFRGEARADAHRARNPDGRVPVLELDDGTHIPESGAILVYLAGKTDRLMPSDVRAKYCVLEWLMFQMGGVGPMLGQAHHFRIYAPEKIEYAVDRYTNEAKRLYGVMDKRLGTHKYIAGSSYSIADIAIFPWLRSWKNQGIDWVDFPNLKGWFDEIAARPAVQRGVDVLAGHRRPLVDDKAREILFGATQYKKH